MPSRIYDTYKNDTMLHRRHIHKTASDIAIATMCDFPSDRHALPQSKFVFHCCSKCPITVTPIQELFSNIQYSFPKIRFCLYNCFLGCTVHGRCHFE